jgi:hypothetical protein
MLLSLTMHGCSAWLLQGLTSYDWSWIYVPVSLIANMAFIILLAAK